MTTAQIVRRLDAAHEALKTLEAREKDRWHREEAGNAAFIIERIMSRLEQ